MKKSKWKKWLLYSVSFFIVLLLISIAWNYFENGKTTSELFNTQELIQALIVSLLGGLLFTYVMDKKGK